MKIAVASDDQIHIADHFGRTRGFLIYTVENRKITASEYLKNTFTHHALGGHDNPNNSRTDHQHTHGPVLEVLSEVQVVISRGMGRRMLIDLESAGKQVFITNAIIAEEAVTGYLAGQLEHDPDKSCTH